MNLINRYMDNMQDILKGYYAAGGKDLFTVVESAEHLAEVADTGMYNPSKSDPVYQKMQTFLVQHNKNFRSIFHKMVG